MRDPAYAGAGEPGMAAKFSPQFMPASGRIAAIAPLRSKQ